MKRILITGANGFIGRALCSALSEKSLIVRGTVRSEGETILKEKAIAVVAVGDIGPETDWTKALDSIDAVVHLAGRAHMMSESTSAGKVRVKDSLLEYLRINAAGTEQLARSAVKAGVRRIVYVSTIKVNGEKTKEMPFSETDMPSPEGYYAVSKWEAELALHRIAQETGLEIVILRLPLVYGPGVKANFLRLMDLVAQRIPLPFASVNNRRSLIYLGNLMDIIITSIIHPKAAGQTYLVSDGEDVSVPGLIGTIASEMEIKPRLMPFPSVFLSIIGRLIGKRDDVERLINSLYVSSNKIRKELGWRPPFTLKQGIHETVKWYKSK